MIYEFYLDIYFLENLVMNYTVLRMITIIEKKYSSRIRCLLTAVSGSLAMCLMMILEVYKVQWMTAIVCMTVEAGMTLAAFVWQGWKKLMYRAVIFRLLSLLAEGSWQILRDYFHMPFPYSMAEGTHKGTEGTVSLSCDSGVSRQAEAAYGTVGQWQPAQTATDGTTGTYHRTGVCAATSGRRGTKRTDASAGIESVRMSVRYIFFRTLSEHRKKTWNTSCPETG